MKAKNKPKVKITKFLLGENKEDKIYLNKGVEGDSCDICAKYGDVYVIDSDDCELSICKSCIKGLSAVIK